MNSIDIINRSIPSPRCATLQPFAAPEPRLHLPFRLLLPVLAALPAAAPAAALQPGLYTVMLQLAVPGVALQLPVRAHRLCLTEREIVYGSAYAVSETAGPARMIGRAEGCRDTTGYEIRMVGRYVPAQPGQENFVQILRAQRVGDCTPR